MVAKGFTHSGRTDFNEIFVSISGKNSFKIIMTLIAHFNFKMHQMGIKIAKCISVGKFSLSQFESYEVKDKEYRVCKLKSFLMALKKLPHNDF